MQQTTFEDLTTFGLYPSGNKVTEKPEILFARLDLKEVLEKVEELHPQKKEEPAEEAKEDEEVIDIEQNRKRSLLMIWKNAVPGW